MKRYTCFFFSLFLILIPASGNGYLLSPNYVIELMVKNYRSIQFVTVNQKVEAFGEDIRLPFASVDERVEMYPLIPIKIWVGGKAITPQTDLESDVNVNRFLIDAQHRYGFYKDVFLSHEVNLLKALLGRLGFSPIHDRLRLLYPAVAYQIGDDLAGGSIDGLWVDKDRFIPLRLVGALISWQEGKLFKESIDIRYGDYRLLKGHIWYPFDIKFFVNGRLFLRIKAISVSFTTS